jgi:serine/threonine protein kinase
MAITAPASPSAGMTGQSLVGRRLGRYQVLAQLAAGGMAGVYVARALAMAGFERLVAVKVLHPHLAHEEEFISMFLDEARLAARIHHPNVVATLDISDTEGDGFFLVMDYIEGHHLGALLQQAAKDGLRVPPPIVVRVVLDALAGLSAAHDLVDENGTPLHLVHRDISPHNIMVGTDGIARLTDFGVAKAEVRLTSTRDGQFKGKLAYMAPEHASTGATDQRSDLFAMGIILWEGLTGRRLFRADTNAQTLNKILVEPIPPPSEARPELAPFDVLCARALERDPDLRFQTADEFAAALEAVVDETGGVATARQVGEVVRRLAADKLSREKARVQEAARGLSSGEALSGSAIPVPRSSGDGSMPGGVPGSEPSLPSRSRSMPAGGWTSSQTVSASAPLPGIPLPGVLGPPPGAGTPLFDAALSSSPPSAPSDAPVMGGSNTPAASSTQVPAADAQERRRRTRALLAAAVVIVAVTITALVVTRTPPPASMTAPAAVPPVAPLAVPATPPLDARPVPAAVGAVPATPTPIVPVPAPDTAAPHSEPPAPAAGTPPAPPGSGRPGSTRRRRDETAASVPSAAAPSDTAPTSAGAASPAARPAPPRFRNSDGADDDDLLNNPYRR